LKKELDPKKSDTANAVESDSESEAAFMMDLEESIDLVMVIGFLKPLTVILVNGIGFLR